LSSNLERVTAPTVAQGAALNIGTDYYLSQDCRVLVVSTGLGFYLQSQHKKPAAANIVAYHSTEIGKPDGAQAILLWTTNGAAAFRQAASEAIRESAELVRHALDSMGGASTNTSRPAQIRAKLLHARGDYGIKSGGVTMKGQIIEESADRIIFQAGRGPIYSLPRREVEVSPLTK
jgi:hypothetical protein